MFIVSVGLKNAVSTPIPSSLSYIWNYGSLLGVMLISQIVSGVFLSFNYEASINFSFDSVVHICHDVPGGWLFRYIHANGASFFFAIIYIHIGRGMYFGGYKNNATWLLGVTILLVSIGTAFLGYVLPWGQMSLWGATVITNLLSAVPYVGLDMTVWLWGGFSVGGPTLTRFFSLHFVLPFAILALVVGHMICLHDNGSSNPLGVSEHTDKIVFHPYFTYNDVVGVVFLVCGVAGVVLLCPDVFIDPDNFLLANPLVTPPHIQPEWYFLFAYAILRSVPSKLGGVVGLFMSVFVLYLFVYKNAISSRFKMIDNMLVVLIFMLFFMLTWVGAMPAAGPIIGLANALSILYFVSILVWLFT